MRRLFHAAGHVVILSGVGEELRMQIAMLQVPHRCGGLLSHRATPSHHPFIDGIFPYKPSIWGYPHLWKAPCANLWIDPRQDVGHESATRQCHWPGDLHWSQRQAGDVADCTAKDAGQAAQLPSCQAAKPLRHWENPFVSTDFQWQKTGCRTRDLVLLMLTHLSKNCVFSFVGLKGALFL